MKFLLDTALYMATVTVGMFFCGWAADIFWEWTHFGHIFVVPKHSLSPHSPFSLSLSLLIDLLRVWCNAALSFVNANFKTDAFVGRN